MTKKYFTIIIFIAISINLTIIPSFSQIIIEPISPPIVTIDTEFWVDIQIGTPTLPVTDLKVVSFELLFTNTSIIDYQTYQIGPFLTEAQATVVPEDQNGKVSVSVYRISGGNSGNGIVIKLKFKVLQNAVPEQTVDFSFSGVQANNSSGDIITLSSNSDITRILPVELSSFYTIVKNDDITLHWQSLSEKNNLGFEVQRSLDKSNFLTIGFVNGNGTTSTPNNYLYIDKNLKNGIYYYRLQQIDYDGNSNLSVIIEGHITIPDNYILFPNYPNPFNPETTILYSLPKAGTVRLKIFDLNGRLVKILVNNKFQDAGVYSVNWDATDTNNKQVSSGIYISKMIVGDIVSHNKLIFQK